MNTDPFISILISSYNHEKYIYSCLKSILNQEYTNFEVLIRDDGSTDETKKIINNFFNLPESNKLKKHIFFGENIGYVASLNFLLKKASGSIIFLCGSDDVFFPRRIKKTIDYYKLFPNIPLIACNAEVISDDGNCIRSSFYNFGDDNYEGLRRHINLKYSSALGLSLGGFGISFKIELLKPHFYQLPETLLFEDGYLSFLAGINKGALLIKEPLMLYRRSIESVSRVHLSLNYSEIVENEIKFLVLIKSLILSKIIFLSGERYNQYTSNLLNKNKSLKYLNQKLEILNLKLYFLRTNKISWKNLLKLIHSTFPYGTITSELPKIIFYSLFKFRMNKYLIRQYIKRSKVL